MSEFIYSINTVYCLCQNSLSCNSLLILDLHVAPVFSGCNIVEHTKQLNDKYNYMVGSCCSSLHYSVFSPLVLVLPVYLACPFLPVSRVFS